MQHCVPVYIDGFRIKSPDELAGRLTLVYRRPARYELGKGFVPARAYHAGRRYKGADGDAPCLCGVDWDATATANGLLPRQPGDAHEDDAKVFETRGQQSPMGRILDAASILLGRHVHWHRLWHSVPGDPLIFKCRCGHTEYGI